MKIFQTSVSITLLTSIILAFCFAATPLTAQINVGKKVKRKVNERVDRKIDETIDHAIEGIFKKKKQETEKDSENQEPQETGVREGNDGEIILNPDNEEVVVTIEEDDEAPIEVLPSNQTGSWTMEVSEYKKGKLKKNMPVTLIYHIDTYKIATEINYEQKNKEAEEAISIFDRKNRTVTMKSINKGEKIALITKIPRIKVGVSNQAVQDGEYTITPTGKTKTIEGYLCKEYRVETKDEVTYAWITEELVFDMTAIIDLVQVKGPKGSMAGFSNVYNIKGFMLEGHTEIKGKDEKRDFFVRDIEMGEVDQEVFSLDGYQVTDMSSTGSFYGK